MLLYFTEILLGNYGFNLKKNLYFLDYVVERLERIKTTANPNILHFNRINYTLFIF